MKIKRLLSFILTLAIMLSSSIVTYAEDLSHFWLTEKSGNNMPEDYPEGKDWPRVGSIINTDSGTFFVGLIPHSEYDYETGYSHFTFEVVRGDAVEEVSGEEPYIFYNYTWTPQQFFPIDKVFSLVSFMDFKNAVYDGTRYVYFLGDYRDYNLETGEEEPEVLVIIRYDILTNSVDYKVKATGLSSADGPNPSILGGSRTASLSYIDGKITGDVYGYSLVGTFQTYTYDYETNSLEIFDTVEKIGETYIKSAFVYKGFSYLYLQEYGSSGTITTLLKVNNITKEADIIYTTQKFADMVITAFNNELYFRQSYEYNGDYVSDIVSYNFKDDVLLISDLITDNSIIPPYPAMGEVVYTHKDKLYVGGPYNTYVLGNQRVSYELKGIVKNQYGNILNDVEVKLLYNGNEIIIKTNEAGEFILNSSSPIGESTLIINKDGYKEKTIDLNFDSNIDLGEVTLDKLSFVIKGTVRDILGDAIRNAKVTVDGNSAFTDEFGIYQIEIPTP